MTVIFAIIWARFYNPATNDHLEISGSGTGDFSITLKGLTEGVPYYARTFATNSAGTAYGNCTYFKAGSSVGISEISESAGAFNIYPNPASRITTFSVQAEQSESMVLTIVDLNNQVVFQDEPGGLPPGENRLELDLSGLPRGMYSCQLTAGGINNCTRKLLIARQGEHIIYHARSNILSQG